MRFVNLICPTEQEEQLKLPEKEWTGERIKVKRRRVTTPEERVAAFREIIKTHSMASIDGSIVDGLSANVWVTVYDALSPKNKAKLAGMTAQKGVKVAWKLIK